ncbi:MAG: Rdx family protein [Pirellulales bacterium]|nr:Rdx family protein [Pirellulales bacterium]
MLEQFKTKISSFEMVPSGGGCFEIDVDGERIYSKLATGEFPNESAILKMAKKKA